MIYYEIICKLILKNNIHKDETNEKLYKYISSAMSKGEYLFNLHKSSGFKNYIFSGLYPTEHDKVYKKIKFIK